MTCAWPASGAWGDFSLRASLDNASSLEKAQGVLSLALPTLFCVVEDSEGDDESLEAAPEGHPAWLAIVLSSEKSPQRGEAAIKLADRTSRRQSRTKATQGAKPRGGDDLACRALGLHTSHGL